jgi:hypothetical protein
MCVCVCVWCSHVNAVTFSPAVNFCDGWQSETGDFEKRPCFKMEIFRGKGVVGARGKDMRVDDWSVCDL